MDCAVVCGGGDAAHMISCLLNFPEWKIGLLCIHPRKKKKKQYKKHKTRREFEGFIFSVY